LRREFRRDYDVFIANNADMALEIISQSTIHVVISDQQMPGMSGWELFQVLKTDHPDMVRLLLTGYADIDSVVHAINYGDVFRYITKPWKPDELKSIVQEAFGRYRLVADNKRLVYQLTEALERERLFSDLKSQMMMTIAHQFRTPLAVINSANDLLKKYWSKMTEEQRDTKLMTVRKQVNHITGLLQAISNAIEIEGGQLPFQPIDTDINQFVRKFVAKFVAKSDTKHRYSFSLNSNSNGTIKVDRKLLTHALDAVLRNARNFSPEHAEITVSTYDKLDDVCLEIHDQGIGIPEADIPYIFDAHFRGSNVTQSESVKGLGLGLKIAKDCIKLHGGTLDVQSESDIGTRVHIRLPRVVD
jgi:signal transduction histidine kinase